MSRGKYVMRLLIIFIVLGLAACKKHDSRDQLSANSDCCTEMGTIRKGSTLGLWCADALFIVRSDNKIIQPVITHDYLNGLSEGSVIRFGHKEVFLGMISCGENIETAELLCVCPQDTSVH
jgi:hypothetical protein